MSTITFVVFMVFVAVSGGLLVTLARRNQQVFAYRQQLTRDIKVFALDDILAGRPWEWRYDTYGAVDYDRMVHQFWKPLPSFWASHAFHEAAQTKSDAVH